VVWASIRLTGPRASFRLPAWGTLIGSCILGIRSTDDSPPSRAIAFYATACARQRRRTPPSLLVIAPPAGMGEPGACIPSPCASLAEANAHDDEPIADPGRRRPRGPIRVEWRSASALWRRLLLPIARSLAASLISWSRPISKNTHDIVSLCANRPMEAGLCD